MALGSIVGNLLRNYSSEASRYVSEENIIVIMDILTSELINPRSIVAANLPSACIAVSEACRYGPIFTWSHMSDSEIRHFSDQLIGERVEPPRKYSSKPLLLISRLIYLLESCTEQKLQECLSNMLCDLAISSLAVREVLLKYFMSIAFRFSKKIDSLAILGESLCKLICGKDFVLSGRYFFIPGASGALSTESRNCPENASSALAELALDHLISSTSSNGRGSAGSKESLVLLLCIAKLCAQEPLVVEKFMYIAKAFMKFLPNGNELISNIASYGIYTLLCNARDDEKLLLVNLMNNELYREPSKYMNAVDSAGSARVSTYVSISALSCDLNAPDLTYKMLMIAWADIHWTSRSWAIRSSPGMLTPTYEDFSEYIEEIIPGLFVLKFHPNRKTSSDIDKLWKTLVKNPEDAINDYKKEICIKILHSIKQESRVAKEQGCAALEDFVSKVNLLQIFDNILVIYSALFEIFDHIEESVRNYAFSAGRALCNALINFVNDVASPISVRMQIISDLVDKLSRQIVSPDKSIEKFCLSIIYKMQECSPKVLENSLKTLIGILLQCLTSLSTHTSGHPTFHSVARSSLSQQHEHSNFESIKMSPIMGALVRFYAALSEDEANNVMFHVIDMLGSATRFSEKAAYLAFLYQTSESVPYKWTFNGQIVPDIFLPLIKSSSNVLSTAASLAISSLCRNSSTIMAASLKKITYLYFEERSGSPKHLLGLCTYQILKGKKFLEKDVLEDFAPTAYIASRNIAGGGQIESWGKVWECVYSLIPTGDNGRIMSMCIKIAIPIVEHGQQSNLKVQAANAVKEMCSKADCDISEDLAPKLLHAFIRALGVCSDEVKHELILSFADVVEHLSWYINKRESHCLNRRIVLDIFLDGINSGDAEIVYYSLSSIVRIYAKVGIGLYSVVQQPIMTVARSFNNKNHSRILNSLRGRTLELEIRLMAFRALEKLWCISKVEMEDYLDEIVVFLVSCLRECVWNIQDAILSTLIPFIRDSNISDSKNNPEDKNSIKIEHLVQCTKAVLECARTAKYTETIKRAFDCLEILVMKLEQSRSIMLESSLREMSLICETLSNSSAGVHITTVFNRVKARVQPLPANI